MFLAPRLEIERKFLVASRAWSKSISKSHVIRQSYLPWAPGITARIRRIDDLSVMTFKTHIDRRCCGEWEIPVRRDMADMLFALCDGPAIEKIRHIVEHKGHVWEVDQFLGRHEGLFVAEIELSHPDERFRVPRWVGAEVTHDKRYRNSHLYRAPIPGKATLPPHCLSNSDAESQ